MMPATWPGIDRNGECEASRVWITAGLAGKAASVSVVAPSAMPAGASGLSSAMAASATAGATSP
jgi:hypothetical protein